LRFPASTNLSNFDRPLSAIVPHDLVSLYTGRDLSLNSPTIKDM